jgi:hypothetical protein
MQNPSISHVRRDSTIRYLNPHDLILHFYDCKDVISHLIIMSGRICPMELVYIHHVLGNGS